MHDSIRTTVVLAPEVDAPAVQAACFAEPTIALAGFAVLDAGVDPCSQPDDALLVCCVEPSPAALAVVNDAARRRPERPVVLVCTEGTAGAAQDALVAGADDVVVVELGGSASQVGSRLAFALAKVLARRSTEPAPAIVPELVAVAPVITRAPVCTVVGPKGGVGKTVTACNLAVAFAKAGRRVVLIDLDLRYGDVGLAMGLLPGKTIDDLAAIEGPLDRATVEAHLTHHASWVRVLPAPTRPDRTEAITPEFVAELLAVLRTCTDHIVVDTSSGFRPEVVAALEAADDVCVVSSMDALALKNARLATDGLRSMGVDDERVTLVLNRANTRLGLARDEFRALLGRKPDVLIPSSRDVVRSVNLAEPVAGHPRSEAARAFRTLAERFVPAPAPTPADPVTVPAVRRPWVWDVVERNAAVYAGRVRGAGRLARTPRRVAPAEEAGAAGSMRPSMLSLCAGRL